MHAYQPILASRQALGFIHQMPNRGDASANLWYAAPAMAKKNKPSALASAASRRLERIGMPKINPEEFAHYMLHAEERGEATRVSQDDGTWVWQVQHEGKTQTLTPSPEVVAAFERMLHEGHPAHD